MARSRRTPPADPLHLHLDDAGHLAEEIACFNCGYNLHGLHLRSACPECGTSLFRAVHGDYLCCADPRWVNRLATGASVLAWSVWLVLPFLLLVMLFSALALFSLYVAQVAWALMFYSFMAMLVISCAGGVAGVWILTIRDSRSRTSQLAEKTRMLARLSGLLSPAVVALMMYLSSTSRVSPLVEHHFFYLALCPAAMAVSIHLFYLSRRLPDGGLAVKFLGLGVGAFLLLMMDAVFGLLDLTEGLRFLPLTGESMPLLGLGYVIWVSVFMQGTELLRRELRRTADRAAAFRAALCSGESVWRTHGGFGVDGQPLSGDPDASVERNQPSNEGGLVEGAGN